ncbi:MAG: SRPBCC family protein [Burkholderiaceae bacterium]
MWNRIVTVAAVAAAGVLLSKKYLKSRGADTESTIEESIEVELPVQAAYNQWTQFEDFPKFMDNVREVRQLDDRHLHWRAEVAGKEQEWDAEITEQIPDKRIAWRSISGAQSAGVVTFHKISDSRTRIMLQMDYTPRGVDEKIGDAIGLVRMQARRTLKRFKELLESRGGETGAWRGSVPQH